MHAWPSPHHPPARNYPVLDHGAIEAATLVQTHGGLQWHSLVSARPSGTSSSVLAREESRLRINKTLEVFPATKSPPLPESTATANQRADQGAHFLRAHFPDVDISADVIRDQITFQTTELANFDPFEGNVLDIAIACGKNIYLVFPMGELRSELNLTPILAGHNQQTAVRPTTTPTRTFSTPIQQITSSPSASESGPATQRDTLLAVRTFGATSLLKFNPSSSLVGDLTSVTDFTSYDTGETSITDIKISGPGAPFEVLLTNKKGRLYGCSLPGGKKTLITLHAGPESSTSAFWKIGLGTKPTECTILSEKALDQLDFRTNQITSLYTELSPTDFLTSVEDYAQDGLIRLCSTSQIIWLDPRYPGKPLLGYKHHRQFDRTLHTDTFFFDGIPSTFLSTKNNGLISIYSVSRQENELIRADDLPYSFLPSGLYYRYPGQTFLQHGSQGITVFRTDEQARVNCFQLQKAPINDQEFSESLIVEQSDEVKELARKNANAKTDLDKYGDQDKIVVDLFPAYDNIFRIRTEQQEKMEEDQAEEFYDVIDQLLTFWQISDSSFEHMLTSYDVAFRSHEVPSKSSRSDFATGSLINSVRGFRAVSQNKFPIEDLRKGVPWHLDISDIQSCIDPSLSLGMGAQELAESLHSYDLIKDDDRTALSIRREKTSREQLTVDLVLSRDVYSPSAFVLPHEVGNNLETMTEALSLGGPEIEEPPEMEFRYLQPVIRAKDKDHYDRDKDSGKDDIEGKSEGGTTGEVSLPMGVRLLLKDWEVGTKPTEYVFQDPYNTTGELWPTHPASAKHRPANTMPSMFCSQRPPPIMPSQLGAGALGLASQPPLKRPPMIVQSQDTFSRSTTVFEAQSQQPFGMGVSQDYSRRSPQYTGSTQILPGPHGGRPSQPKKKPVKKRLGGF